MLALTSYWREVLIVILLAGILFGGYEWLQQHDAMIKLNATLEAEQKVQAKLQADIQARDTQIAVRDAQVAAVQRQIVIEKQAVQTPAQVVQELPKVLPNLPAPITQTPSGDLQVPQVSAKPLYDRLADCKGFEIDATACHQTTQDLKADKVDMKAQMDSLRKERDAAIHAAKGSWLRNLGKDAVKVGIAFGAGYLASRATH